MSKMARKNSLHCPVPVRVGVIGAGAWATSAHIPAIIAHPNAVLASVQSRDRKKVEKIASDFRVDHVCTKVAELLEHPGLDAVVVSSTPNMHFEETRRALGAGKHVLIEKPMTITVAQSRELCNVARQKRRCFVISCPWHYTAHGLEARRRILGGELGTLKMISVLMTNSVADLIKGRKKRMRSAERAYLEPERGSYSDPTVAGGGQIYCQVSHVGAYLSFLTGLRPSQVFARFDYDGGACDIYDVLSIELEKGVLVSIATTGAIAEEEVTYEVRVFGSRGMIYLELWKGLMAVWRFGGSRIDVPALKANEIYPNGAPVTNLIDVIRGAAINYSPAELGLAGMEIIEGACRSAKLGCNVVIR